MRPQTTHTSALGVAMAAGMAEGINACNLRPENREKILHDTFLPTTIAEERNVRYKKWKMAVQRSLGWAISKKSAVMTDERYSLLASVPASIFLITSFTLLVMASGNH